MEQKKGLTKVQSNNLNLANDNSIDNTVLNSNALNYGSDIEQKKPLR